MSTPHFLIVDRNTTMRGIIRHQLYELDYDRITEASNAETALLQLGRRDFDIVLTELDLPGMSGLEFVSYIRETLMSTVPVLVISGDASRENLVRLAQAGANGFLVKPFTPVAFEQHVRNLLNHS
jgi:two-component system chemotaxis response regulator CheY